MEKEIDIEKERKEIEQLNGKAKEYIKNGKKLNGKAQQIITKSKKLFIL